MSLPVPLMCSGLNSLEEKVSAEMIRLPADTKIIEILQVQPKCEALEKNERWNGY